MRDQRQAVGPACGDVERWANFVATRRWTFAKTYASTYPHEWTSAKPGTDAEFMWAVDYTRGVGTVEPFWGHKQKYLYHGQHKYWTMGAPAVETSVINRCFPNPLDYAPQIPAGDVSGRQAEVWVELARLAPWLPGTRRREVEAICASYLKEIIPELSTRKLFLDSRDQVNS